MQNHKIPIFELKNSFPNELDCIIFLIKKIINIINKKNEIFIGMTNQIDSLSKNQPIQNIARFNT